MKKRIVAVLLGLSILMIVFSGVKMSQEYNADPTIYYDGKKKEFAFFNVKNRDIFTDLKEIMPGDRKEQKVIFKAQNIRSNTKIFLNINRSYNKEIMQYIKIYAGEKELSNDKEYIELANFSKEYETIIRVVVEVPKEVGNEIEGLKHNMDWNILIQEEGGQLIDIPNTFDDTNIVLYVIVCFLSILIMGYSIKKLRDYKVKG